MADMLGLERPGGKGNYKSPHHKDKSPSLSISKDGKSFKDWSAEGVDNASGSMIDLLMWVEGIAEVSDAVRRIHELFGIPTDPPPGSDQPRQKMSLPELVASHCFGNTDPTRAYLIDERKLTEAVVDRAIKRKAVGFNDYCKDSVPPGEPTHGGPAVAFIVRTINPGHIMAVDTRYLDPDLNGGIKTQAIGEKYGYPWFTCRRELERAHTLVIVESPINALTVECAELPGTAAIATRGTGNVDNIDWRFCIGKKVLICMDNDPPNDHGRRPGQMAAWKLHEQLTMLNISAMMVDQIIWEDFGWNDLNDILQEKGPTEIKKRLRMLEPWIIQGLPGHGDPEVKTQEGKSRIYLPPHDFTEYWKYRAKEDFVSYVKLGKEDEEGNQQKHYIPVCGFRIASISRVRISGYTAMMTGEQDTSPDTIFGATVQIPRHEVTLKREVIPDKKFYKLELWEQFGAIHSPTHFKRMINILERGTNLGARDVVNFVGLAWLNGKLIVNEGPDCNFDDPKQQCRYHNLRFPSGPVTDAKRVIEAYHETFGKSAALQLLVWSLGGHLKAFLGFWPHLMMQAEKSSGKSTLIKRLERTIGFTMLSGESIGSMFRILTSISATSHPIGWEELSAQPGKTIKQAIRSLQECYQYSQTFRGTAMTEFVQSAPVLLAGEDVPVKEIIGKLIRCNLEQQGTLIPENLPRFPVLEWLQWLTTLPKDQVNDLNRRVFAFVMEKCRAPADDMAAQRMARNYAALITTWRLLCDFAGIPREFGGFIQNMLSTMNDHIADTVGERDPWVWITDVFLSEIDRGTFRYSYKFDEIEGTGVEWNTKSVLLVRISHIMKHIEFSRDLKEFWDGCSVKSSSIYKRLLIGAGVLVMASNGKPETHERTVNGRRVSNMVAFDLESLAQYGLHASPRVENNYPEEH